MYSIVHKRGLQKADIKDLFQDSVIEVLTTKKEYDKESFEKFFISTIYDRNAINLEKKQKRLKSFDLGDENFENTYLEFSEIEHDIEALLPKIIEVLPSKYSGFIKLHIEGKNNAEIAKTLNLTLGTVAKYKSECQIILRESILPLFKN
ncbi:MAG: sigma-70 family RNA polymerase sigma factor [Saprospiraceae bacterium]|nr:sigma-70 family RNA polymerase sigma factor [Candidatus Defluviibacterium haderslevense]